MKVSKRLKWLGFFLYDGDLFNPFKHTRDRFLSSGRKEIVTLRWMAKNFSLYPKTMKNYFMTRCMAKFAYGSTTFLKLAHPEFYKK